MLEIPEARVISEQLTETIVGNTIQKVQANSSPHKFAFYSGNPANYPTLLNGRKIEFAEAFAGLIEISAEQVKIVLGDGTNIRYFKQGEIGPEKHQLRIEFQDGSSIICNIQMYGGMWAFVEGTNANPYYLAAKEKPNPLSDEFDDGYFSALLVNAKPTLSAKAFLATEQRIPGLGNGVLQDILYNVRINPRTKLQALSEIDKQGLYKSIKQTLLTMTASGGRDTEKDLFGNPGGYQTILSNKTLDKPCPRCGGTIVRQAFLGGNVYFCPNCQPIKS